MTGRRWITKMTTTSELISGVSILVVAFVARWISSAGSMNHFRGALGFFSALFILAELFVFGVGGWHALT